MDRKIFYGFIWSDGRFVVLIILTLNESSSIAASWWVKFSTLE